MNWLFKKDNITLLILLNAISAATFPLMKSVVIHLPPQFLTGARMLVGGILLLALQYFLNKRQFFFEKDQWRWLAGLAFFNIFLINMLQYWALCHVTASKAAFIANLTPFFSIIISYLFLHERISWGKVAAVTLTFVSFIPLILARPPSTPECASDVPRLFFPEIALALAALSSVIGWTFMKKIIAKRIATDLMANGLSMIMGGLAFFPLAFTFEWSQIKLAAIHNVGLFFGYLLLLVLVNNVFSYGSYGFLLQFYNPTLLFLVGFTNPLFALLYSWIFLGEPMSIPFGIATVGVCIGVYWYYHEEKRLGYL